MLRVETWTHRPEKSGNQFAVIHLPFVHLLPALELFVLSDHRATQTFNSSPPCTLSRSRIHGRSRDPDRFAQIEQR